MDYSKQILTLEKVTNDPKWSGVIKLYSGLFDDEEDRIRFIVDTSEYDLLLATECSQDSILKNDVLDNSILDKAKRQFEFINSSEFGRTYPEFISVLLIKPLNREIIMQFLDSEALKKRKYFKQTSSYLINNLSFEDLLELIYTLKPEDKNLFISSILKGLYKSLINSQEYDKINSILSAMVYLGYNPSGTLDSLKSRNIKLQRNIDVLAFLKIKYSHPIKRKYMNIDSLCKKLVFIFGYSKKELDNYFKINET